MDHLRLADGATVNHLSGSPSKGHLAVIGAGSWGTVFAAVCAAQGPVHLWARDVNLADQISQSRTNPRYTGSVVLPPGLDVTAVMAEAVAGADVVAMAVPSAGMRTVAEQVREWIEPGVAVISLAKGLDPRSGEQMSQVLTSVLKGHPVAVLTGPNLAAEILTGQPAAGVIAAGDLAVAQMLQRRLVNPVVRLYTNTDVVGCEVAGVVKNVIAIAVGMAEGMGFGANTRATLITRGLAEISRLGVAMGADPLTFAGLAGVGDLVATCLSEQSRNHSVGFALGQGTEIADILESMTMVAEGVRSSVGVLQIARRYGVEMPITEQVVAVCHDGRSADAAMALLMGRGHRSEREEQVTPR
jgi:glycerol-3-phosphate dehydrogenase (NAD(P)+)